MQMIDDVMQTTRSRAWKVLGTPAALPVRTGLEMALGHRRFSQVFFGPQLDAVRRGILRAFIGGDVPTPASLIESLDRPEQDVKADLDELARRGVITMTAGAIAACYPFSMASTLYRVRLGGRDVHAMSAIDALGIPVLAGGEGEILSTSPHSGREIHIAITGYRVAESVLKGIVLGVAGEKADSLLDALFRHTRFFTSSKEAREWLTDHRELRGNILSLHTAMAVARHVFDDRFALMD